MLLASGSLAGETWAQDLMGLVHVLEQLLSNLSVNQDHLKKLSERTTAGFWEQGLGTDSLL